MACRSPTTELFAANCAPAPKTPLTHMSRSRDRLFARTLAEVAAARTTREALGIIRTARASGELGAVSERQLTELIDAAYEKGDEA